MNIQLRKLYLLIQYFIILQLRHTTFNTQSLKEIHSGRETGLIDTGPFRESKTGKLALIAQQMGAAPRYEEPGVIASSVLCEKKNQSLNLKKL